MNRPKGYRSAPKRIRRRRSKKAGRRLPADVCKISEATRLGRLAAEAGLERVSQYLWNERLRSIWLEAYDTAAWRRRNLERIRAYGTEARS